MELPQLACGCIGASPPAAEGLAPIADDRISPVVRRERCVDVRRQDIEQSHRPLVKRAGGLRLPGEKGVVVFGIRDTSGRRVGGKVHKVEAVVGLQPEIGDEEIRRPFEKASARRLKVGTDLDVSHQAERVLCGNEAAAVGIDEENFLFVASRSEGPQPLRRLVSTRSVLNPNPDPRRRRARRSITGREALFPYVPVGH
jgi:hypothetical protein